MGVVAVWGFYIACLVCLVGGWLAVDLLLGFDLVCWVWFVDCLCLVCGILPHLLFVVWF